MRNKQVWYLAALLTAALACTNGSTSISSGDAGHKTGNNGKADAASDMLPELVDILSAESALGMPAVAREWNANQFEAHVEVVSVPGDVREVAEPIVESLVQEYGGGSDSPLGFIDIPDGHVSLMSGFNEPAIKNYLVDLVVAEQAKSRVREIVFGEGFPAYYLWFQIYDIGAEIIGDEIILIQPFSSDNAILIRLSYVQA